jgi:hypothetical protein
LLIYTHRKNITRLREGTESKIYVWKSRRVREEQRKQAEAAAAEEQSLDEVVEELVDEFMEENEENQPK